MASISSLRSEERIGLGVAVALHLALVAALIFQPGGPKPFPMPERMVVSLSNEVGLKSTAPRPAEQAQAAIAPTLAPEPAPAPQPKPAPKAEPRPQPAAQAKPRPSPLAKPAPPATKKGGGSRIGNDFLKGASSGEGKASDALPASEISASAKASVGQAIARQLKPHWSAPQGVDAELLVTIVAFDLNPDGSLAGPPRVVDQSGDTPANLSQKGRHAEQALRAVRLAAPFDLDPKYYNVWKSIKSAKFDRTLSP